MAENLIMNSLGSWKDISQILSFIGTLFLCVVLANSMEKYFSLPKTLGTYLLKTVFLLFGLIISMGIMNLSNRSSEAAFLVFGWPKPIAFLFREIVPAVYSSEHLSWVQSMTTLATHAGSLFAPWTGDPVIQAKVGATAMFLAAWVLMFLSIKIFGPVVIVLLFGFFEFLGCAIATALIGLTWCGLAGYNVFLRIPFGRRISSRANDKYYVVKRRFQDKTRNFLRIFKETK